MRRPLWLSPCSSPDHPVNRLGRLRNLDSGTLLGGNRPRSRHREQDRRSENHRPIVLRSRHRGFTKHPPRHRPSPSLRRLCAALRPRQLPLSARSQPVECVVTSGFQALTFARKSHEPGCFAWMRCEVTGLHVAREDRGYALYRTVAPSHGKTLRMPGRCSVHRDLRTPAETGFEGAVVESLLDMRVGAVALQR